MQQSLQRNSLALRIVLASFPDMRGEGGRSTLAPSTPAGVSSLFGPAILLLHIFSRYLKSENPRLVTKDAGDTCNYRPPPPCSTDTTPSHQPFLLLGFGVHQLNFCTKYEVCSQRSFTSSLSDTLKETVVSCINFFGTSSPRQNTKT